MIVELLNADEPVIQQTGLMTCTASNAAKRWWWKFPRRGGPCRGPAPAVKLSTERGKAKPEVAPAPEGDDGQKQGQCMPDAQAE